MHVRGLWVVLIALALGLSACPKDIEPGFDPARPTMRGSAAAGVEGTAQAHPATKADKTESERGRRIFKPGKNLEKRGQKHPRIDIRRMHKPQIMRKPAQTPSVQKGPGSEPKAP